MKLFLVQHGDAVAKELDPERPLSERGQQDVQAMAGFLSQAGISAQQVLHSGKRRAQQTAAILAEAMLTAGKPKTVSGIAPNDDVGVFAEALAGWKQDTVVVGHLPFMARLVSLLLSGDAERELIRYQPGSVVCLERGEAGAWCINWMLRPELL
jgi:phosphohistidine phosphatase